MAPHPQERELRTDFATRRAFFLDSTRLKLWYVWHLLKTGQCSFAEAIVYRVDLYRRTPFFDGVNHPAKGFVDPRWDALTRELEAVYLHYSGDPTPVAIEEEGLDLLRPYIEARIVGEQQGTFPLSPPGTIVVSPYGCFTRDYRPPFVHLHFSNATRPRSPFEDMPALVRSLLHLLEERQRDEPGITTVACSSWLNSLPPFQDLFPPAWHASAQLAPPNYTGGWWGQMEDRTGLLHARNAQHLQETGEFRFRCLRRACSLEELQKHLQEWLCRHPTPS